MSPDRASDTAAVHCTSNAWIFRNRHCTSERGFSGRVAPQKRGFSGIVALHLLHLPENTRAQGRETQEKCGFLNCGKVQWTAWRRSEIRKEKKRREAQARTTLRQAGTLLSSTFLSPTTPLLQSPSPQDARLSRTTAPLRTMRPYRPRSREIALLPATHGSPSYTTNHAANPAVIPFGARELGERPGSYPFQCSAASRNLHITGPMGTGLMIGNARRYWSTHV
jgi:hypothetical protein